jgi:hypothetical protein
MNKSYVFTRAQLSALLSSAIDLQVEYFTNHRPDDVDDYEAFAYAHTCAVRDSLEGLNSEAELLANGETLRPTHSLLDPTETIENLRALRNRLQDYLRELDPQGNLWLVITEASDSLHVDVMTVYEDTIKTLLYAPTVGALLGQEVQIRNLISSHVGACEEEYGEEEEAA